jgi:hypothetical protein
MGMIVTGSLVAVVAQRVHSPQQMPIWFILRSLLFLHLKPISSLRLLLLRVVYCSRPTRLFPQRIHSLSTGRLCGFVSGSLVLWRPCMGCVYDGDARC